MPLLYIALGFIGGYLVGKRTVFGIHVLQREVGSVLDSVGRLAHTGALHRIDDLQLRNGSTTNGVQLAIKTRQGADWQAPDWWQDPSTR